MPGEPEYGDDDLILTGGGADIVVGGLGSDLILAGGEDDAVDVAVGDNGRAVFNAAGILTFIESTVPASGGDDVIATGRGADVVIGGAGDDVILAATAGDLAAIDPGDDAADVVVGDNGQAIFTDARELVRIETTAPADGGDDVIVTGDGPDIVLGGVGDDIIAAAGDANAFNDRDVVIGDNGVAIFDPASPESLLRHVFTTDPAHGGDDRILTGNDADIVQAGSARRCSTPPAS